MSARRVLYVHSSSGRYGADRQLQLIAGGVDRRRYEPIAVLPERGELAGDLEAAGVEVLTRPLSVLRRELATPRGIVEISAAGVRDGAALSRLVSRRRVSLVHSNTSVVLGGAAAAALSRVPHVWHVREIYARYGSAWPPYRRLLATAKALPCISRATASQFRPGDPVQVIPDGLAAAVRPTESRAARSVLALPPQAPVVAVIGRVSDWKGQDVLVRALAEPALVERGAIGVIAGEAWPGAEDRLRRVLELADRLGVTERLRCVGFRDDVDTVYGAADVVAVPSTEPEPLGDVAIEAAAAGCAIVATWHGGLPEILRDGVTGRLIAPGDPRSLAAATAELLDDPAERERLGSAAARDVSSRFSAANLLERIQALYDSVV